MTRDIDDLLAALERRLPAPVTPPAGYIADARGRLVPESLVRPEDALEDQAVRRILAYGLDLADQIARFRAHTFSDLAALMDVIAGKYGRARGGRRGNCTFTSYDGRLKVTVQVQDRLAFGPELHVAKELIDDCVSDWTSQSGAEVRTLVQHAFETDREGLVNRVAIFRLLRIEIDDERWRRAQDAIRDSIRTIGSKTYVRLYARPAPEQGWRPVPIDIAADWPLPEEAGPAGGAPAAPADPLAIPDALRRAAPGRGTA